MGRSGIIWGIYYNCVIGKTKNVSFQSGFAVTEQNLLSMNWDKSRNTVTSSSVAGSILLTSGSELDVISVPPHLKVTDCANQNHHLLQETSGWWGFIPETSGERGLHCTVIQLLTRQTVDQGVVVEEYQSMLQKGQNHKYSTTFTLHLLLAKFFLICLLTDSWMFLQSAVSPAILTHRDTLILSLCYFCEPLYDLFCVCFSPGVSEGLLARETLGWIFFHQTADEILGWERKTSKRA